MVICGYTTKPRWVCTANKMTWDWLESSIVPVVLSICEFCFNSMQIQPEPVTQKTQKDYEQFQYRRA